MAFQDSPYNKMAFSRPPIQKYDVNSPPSPFLIGIALSKYIFDIGKGVIVIHAVMYTYVSCKLSCVLPCTLPSP